jgi:hypothetical protein
MERLCDYKHAVLEGDGNGVELYEPLPALGAKDDDDAQTARPSAVGASRSAVVPGADDVRKAPWNSFMIVVPNENSRQWQAARRVCETSSHRR